MLVERGQVISGEFAQLIAANIQANYLMGEPGQISICSHVDITLNVNLHGSAVGVSSSYNSQNYVCKNTS